MKTKIRYRIFFLLIILSYAMHVNAEVYEAENAYLCYSKTGTNNAGFNEIVVEPGNPDFEMKGFATVNGDGYATTTGGTGGAVTIVTNLQELKAYAVSRENVTAPGILYIRGKISSPVTEVVTIKHGANITILGEGEFGEMENVGLNIRNYKNVIIRNLKIHEVKYPNDAITIDECQHVWVDHNELYSKIGPGIGVDTYDGLLDIKNGSKYVTVSWNKIHHHMKTSLIGHTDNTAQQVIDSQFQITFHNNYFHDTDGRNPSIRWGAIHLFNNYFENISDYGIAVRQGAHAKLENNHYHNVRIPITTNKFDGEGYVCESGTIYTGTASEENNSITRVDCDFWSDLPYSYTLEATNSVALMVDSYAGVGIINTGNKVNLSGITANVGILSPAFNSYIFQYQLVVPQGTESVELSAFSFDTGAIVTGTGTITDIPSSVTLTVSSSDMSTSRDYEISISSYIPSSDADLASLAVSPGVLSPDFNPSVLVYSLELPYGTSTLVLTGTPNNPAATTEGTGELTAIPGTFIISVTAEDGTVKDYSVNVSVAAVVKNAIEARVLVYPNPAHDKVYIHLNEAAQIELCDLQGRTIRTITMDGTTISLNIIDYQPGIYILKIKNTKGTLVHKFVKE